MSTPAIYGATLNNVQFGATSYDQGLVQTSEIDHATENEQIRDNEGRWVGGAKYGPNKRLNITYISNAASPGDIEKVTNTTTISFKGFEWQMENVREAETNTGFLTFTAEAFYSPDFAAST